MRRLSTTLVLVCISISFIACGKSDEDLRKEEQARRDSLENARALRQAEITSEVEGEAKSGNGAASNLDISTLRFTETGNSTVQVGAWRSETKAEALVDVWKKRGFGQAYMESTGNAATGDVWFRVRLGRMESKSSADALANHVKQKYGVNAWVDIKR